MYVRTSKGRIRKVTILNKDQTEIDEQSLAAELIDATLQGDNEYVLMQFESVDDAAFLLTKYLGTIKIPKQRGCCG